MKKVWLGSLIAALAVEIIGAAVNLISYATTGYFLICNELQGGEWTGESGFGMLLNHTYPMSSMDHPVSGSEWISFDLSSLILTLVICLILFSIVFFIIFKVKSADRIRELEHSDEE
ncbi:MAG: hypothetical protein SPL61_10950 [Saccharofermentans sp.]|nr:hypothetical protein [Saccharofermentans sp.]